MLALRCQLLSMGKFHEIDFIGIGTQKSGTSWLNANLRRLPDFDLPYEKEFHYFDRDSRYPNFNILRHASFLARMKYHKSRQASLNHLFKRLNHSKSLHKFLWHTKWFFSYYNDDWYLSHFRKRKKITGEITPSYAMLFKKDIRDMYAVAPNAKLILLLRNPIERAWSYYKYKKYDTSDPKVVHEVMKSTIQLRGQDLRANYIRCIRNYSTVYPKNQILVGFFDAIQNDPQALLGEIVSFLGGDPKNISEYCDVKKKRNASYELDCPPNVLQLLKDHFHPQITELANEYGGYFNCWLEDTYGEKSTNLNPNKPTFVLSEIDK